MSFRGTYLLFGAVLVILVAAIIVTVNTSDTGSVGDYVLASLHGAGKAAKDITGLDVEIKGAKPETLSFVRTGERTWRLAQPYEGKVNSTSVQNLVQALVDLKRAEKADVTSNLARFGLDNPSVVATLKSGDRTWTIHFGNTTVGSASTALAFVTTSDNPKTPMAVRRSSLEELYSPTAKGGPRTAELVKGVADFRTKDLLGDGAGLATDTFQAIKLSQGTKELALKRGSAGTWTFEKPTNYGEADKEGDPNAFGNPLPITGVNPLINALTALRISSGTDYVDPAPEVAVSGLDPASPDCLKIETTFEPQSFGSAEKKPAVTDTLLIGKKTDEKGDFLFAKLGDDPTVFKLPAGPFASIRAVLEKPDTLRDRNLLNLVTSQVDAIDLKVGNDPLVELRKTGEPKLWKVYDGPTFNSANGGTVMAVLNALTAKRAVKDFPPAGKSDADLGFDQPAAEVSLWQDGLTTEAAPAPKEGEKPAGPPKPKVKGPPTVKLTFGKKDKDIIYVRRTVGDTKSDVAVSSTLLATLSKSELDFLDSVLPSFSTDQATTLTFNRGSEIYELEQEKKEGTPPVWKFKQPASLAGRKADVGKIGQILNQLSSLTATGLLAKKATEGELERFGLKPPRVTVTVGLGKDTRVFFFGKPRDDNPAMIYAKQGERDLVFYTTKSVLENVEAGDLIDPLLFTFDRTKVKALKLTGWHDLVGEAKTLEIEKKDNTWVLKSGGNYAIDPARVENFLLDVSSPRAERFLKGGGKPEMKLDPAVGGMVIAITLDGEMEPLLLNVGAETEGKYVFATSNRVANEAFLLLKDRFAGVRGKVTYFRKD